MSSIRIQDSFPGKLRTDLTEVLPIGVVIVDWRMQAMGKKWKSWTWAR